MLVLSSPSGAGKTTLSRMLLTADPVVELSVSVTTRPRRAERESTAATITSSTATRFDADGARTASCWNGPRCSAISTARRARRSRRRWPQGRDVLFDIDWQGTQQLAREGARRRGQRSSCCRRRSPNWSGGCARARQDIDDVIRARMAKAGDEMSHWAEYDYVVVNDDIDQAFARGARDPGRRTAQARAADRAVRLRPQSAGEL